MTNSLIAPLARARFVVTLPPEPSHVGRHLQSMAGQSFTTLTDTKDAFLHLARRAQERLFVTTPYIDPTGANWAADIFEATKATTRILILRGKEHSLACGAPADRLKQCTYPISTTTALEVEHNDQSDLSRLSMPKLSWPTAPLLM